MTSLELILSEIPKKSTRPAPPAAKRRPALQKNFLHYFLSRPHFLFKRKKKIFCSALSQIKRKNGRAGQSLARVGGCGDSSSPNPLSSPQPPPLAKDLLPKIFSNKKARSAPAVGTFSCENERDGNLSYYESASGLVFPIIIFYFRKLQVFLKFLEVREVGRIRTF